MSGPRDETPSRVIVYIVATTALAVGLGIGWLLGWGIVAVTGW